jgi:hypothetical protein
MSEAQLTNQRSPSGNRLRTSTQRFARWRARRRRGVLYVAGLEVFPSDLRVLKHYGYLTSDDPGTVGKDEFETGLWSLLDGLARRLGVLARYQRHRRRTTCNTGEYMS